MVLACLLGAALCFSPPASAARKEAPRLPTREDNLKAYQKVIELVDKHFYDPELLERKGFAQRIEEFREPAAAAATYPELYRVINRLLRTVDVSHLFVDGALAEPGSSSGVNLASMIVKSQQGKLTVESLLRGSPFDTAGVKVGWELLSVNGFPPGDVRGFYAATSPIAYIFRDAEGKEQSRLLPYMGFYDLLSASALADHADKPVKDGGYRKLPGDVVFIRFSEFRSDPWVEMGDSLRDNREARAAIIDLRSNSGGKVFDLLTGLAEFFPERVDAGYFTSRKGKQKRLRSISILSAKFKPPVVVLVSEQTASAAEIFAHVMQFNGRATIVGRTTAGAVLNSSKYKLPGGGKMTIPMRAYTALDGQPLEKRGVTPDIVVPMPTAQDARAGRDPDLAAALAFIESIPQQAAGSQQVTSAAFPSAPATGQFPPSSPRCRPPADPVDTCR